MKRGGNEGEREVEKKTRGEGWGSWVRETGVGGEGKREVDGREKGYEEERNETGRSKG